MPRSNLTQLSVERLRPPTEGAVTYWDKMLPGFGLRVSSRGRKTWLCVYRVAGKPVMETLGTMAVVPRLADARDAAREAMRKAKAGVHPVAERRAAARAAEADKAAAVSAAREAIEGRFEAVARRWLAEGWRRSKAKRRWSPGYAAEVRRIVEHDVFPQWRDRPIRSIAKADVDAILDAKAARRERPRKGTENGADVQSNRMLARLKTLFAWALAEGCVAADPTAGVTIRGQETERDRWLDDDELAWFWRGCERAGWPYGSIFRLMLLTAQRESEVAGMRWSEVDLDKKPGPSAQRTKSDRAHIVHLSDLACEVLRAAPRMAGDLAFPSRVGTAVGSFTKAKNRVDDAMTAQKRKATGDDAAEIEALDLHDLRRSAATVMAERLKVREEVADKILNHANRRRAGSLAKLYNRAEYLDERRAALEALGRYVETLVRPGGAGNVVPIGAARA